jgi:hypothetical protein
VTRNLTLEDQFPSVPLAYEIALNSYDVLIRRIDSIDGRLQTVLAFFGSSTVAVLGIVAGRKLDFHSKWFYAAIGLMMLAIILTAIARLEGAVKVIDPSKLNSDEWLASSEWEFKNLIVQAAAQAFQVNNRLITRKWRTAIAVIVIFSLGAMCLAVWVIRMTASA